MACRTGGSRERILIVTPVFCEINVCSQDFVRMLSPDVLFSKYRYFRRKVKSVRSHREVKTSGLFLLSNFWWLARKLFALHMTFELLPNQEFATFALFSDEVEIPFHANGVEREMDELDIKLIRSRCSPVLPSSRSAPIRGLDEPLTLEELRSMLLSRGRANKRDLTCVFCKNNNEAVFIYTSHNLKDENGRVLCPILREYECPNCRAKGDNAHTLKYCPLAPEAMGIGSLRTPRTSTGRRRTRAGELAARLGRRPPPSQLLPADKFQRVIGPLL